MALLGIGCGENIHLAAIFQFEPFPQVGYRQGEVSGGYIGFIDARKCLFKFAFVHGADAVDDESSAREALYLLV